MHDEYFNNRNYQCMSTPYPRQRWTNDQFTNQLMTKT